MGEVNVGLEKCCCGFKGCSTYWLTGIGRFCQGSGFEKDEAEMIVDAFGALKEIVRIRDEESDGVDNLRVANIARAVLAKAA